MRFVCEIAAREHIVEAETAENAAWIAAQREAEHGGHTHFTVNVAEANEANLPLIAGDYYEVDLTRAAPPDAKPDCNRQNH